MRICAFAFCILVAAATGASAAASLDKDKVNAATFDPKKPEENRALLLKAQVLLDRARFSPGVIDGHNGENLQHAIAAFRQAHDMAPEGTLDAETFARLQETSSAPALVEYTLRPEDVKGPFTRKIPAKMEDQADLERLGYRNAAEKIAEMFHMDEDLLKELNPGRALNRAGETIVVADVRADARAKLDANAVARIEVRKGEKVLHALDRDGGLVAVYPASIGSEEKPAPSGTLKIKGIARNPTYTYNPDYAFKGVKAKEKFTIRPGPNNPVGTVWIDLSEDSYGIHGTPEPAKVGKTASHGCVRLTNWDVEDLAGLVKKGVEVAFLD